MKIPTNCIGLTLFRRPSYAHNVYITLDERWNNVVYQLGNYIGLANSIFVKRKVFYFIRVWHEISGRKDIKQTVVSVVVSNHWKRDIHQTSKISIMRLHEEWNDYLVTIATKETRDLSNKTGWRNLKHFPLLNYILEVVNT